MIFTANLLFPKNPLNGAQLPPCVCVPVGDGSSEAWRLMPALERQTWPEGLTAGLRGDVAQRRQCAREGP